MTVFAASLGQKEVSEVREVDVVLIAHPEGRGLGCRYHLAEGGTLRFGRSSTNEVVLSDVPAVSRFHARLDLSDGKLLLKDLGSRNGTFVEDHKITEPTELHSGDRFSMGGVHFKAFYGTDAEQRYFEAIRDLAIRDPLTRAFNRRFFEEEGSRLLNLSLRWRRPVALLLFDVDHFKSINDRFGHPCGDYVLRETVSCVNSKVRQEDLVARIGGEEFCVLCPESDLRVGLVVAERLRKAVSEYPYLWEGETVRVTVSFGVAAQESSQVALSELIASADRALYAAKGAGRNAIFAAYKGELLPASELLAGSAGS
jgi:diguanylate cyclase (GGDEF)-like protein